MLWQNAQKWTTWFFCFTNNTLSFHIFTAICPCVSCLKKMLLWWQERGHSSSSSIHFLLYLLEFVFFFLSFLALWWVLLLLLFSFLLCIRWISPVSISTNYFSTRVRFKVKFFGLVYSNFYWVVLCAACINYGLR